MFRLSLEEEGQVFVEYALITTLVGVLVIEILLVLGPVVGNVFSNVTVTLNGDSSGASGAGSGPGSPFSVTTINAFEFESGGSESKVKWTATCSGGAACTVSVLCEFSNGGTIKGSTNSTSANPGNSTECKITTGGSNKATVTVTNAAAAGFVWDGVKPSDTAVP
jgi:Flp pilus assembly pilin Flp